MLSIKLSTYKQSYRLCKDTFLSHEFRRKYSNTMWYHSLWTQCGRCQLDFNTFVLFYTNTHIYYIYTDTYKSLHLWCMWMYINPVVCACDNNLSIYMYIWGCASQWEMVLMAFVIHIRCGYIIVQKICLVCMLYVTCYIAWVLYIRHLLCGNGQDNCPQDFYSQVNYLQGSCHRDSCY